VREVGALRVCGLLGLMPSSLFLKALIRFCPSLNALQCCWCLKYGRLVLYKEMSMGAPWFHREIFRFRDTLVKIHVSTNPRQTGDQLKTLAAGVVSYNTSL